MSLVIHTSILNQVTDAVYPYLKPGHWCYQWGVYTTKPMNMKAYDCMEIG